jgi:hypothetical protein
MLKKLFCPYLARVFCQVCQTRLEKFLRDKHPIFFLPKFVNYGRIKLYNIGPGGAWDMYNKTFRIHK